MVLLGLNMTVLGQRVKKGLKCIIFEIFLELLRNIFEFLNACKCT